MRSRGGTIALGLRANWRQFALLVAVNAFVGGMVGLERSIVPLLAQEKFGLTSATAAVSFIATFGLAKAVTNLFAGHLSGRFRRRPLLVAGWLFGLPVPWLLIFAQSWSWVVGANLLLGVNQGLAWSMTVNMKVDLVGPRRRGLALGLNEAAGYLSVAAAAYLSGVIAERYGLSPEPFYLGIAFSALGLALSALLIRDTTPFVQMESAGWRPAPPASLGRAFAEATWRKRRLWGTSQAGFVNNLNDAVIWGIFPLLFLKRDMTIEQISVLAAVYPLFWGSLQLVTGALSDVVGRRLLIVLGIGLQGVAIWACAEESSFGRLVPLLALIGLGTAMVYPTLLAAISDFAHPEERASVIGVYRFWRDGGAVVGALAGGLVADALGLETAVRAVAVATLISAVIAAYTLAGTKTQTMNGQEVLT